MRHRSLRVATLILFVMLVGAGCAAIASRAIGVRPGTYNVLPPKTFQVPMRDGVDLATDVYLPKAEGPFPAVLIRTPYGKGGGNSFIAKTLAKRGYAVVIQDVRGRYGSRGAWTPFLNEGRDGSDTVKWLTNRRWCTGKVGLFGMSYFGYTQWQTAAYAGDKIDAFAPTVAGSRIYDILYRQGVFSYSTAGHWGLGASGSTAAQGIEFKPGRSFIAPLIRTDDRHGHDLPFFNDWVRHEKFDSYWEPASAEGRWKDIDAPALMIGGWYDIFGGATLDDWEKMRHNAGSRARSESRLIIGPWNHTFSKKMHGVNYGRDADFLKLSKVYVSWYDEHLMNSGKAKLPRVQVFTTGENRWQNLNDWPPPDAKVQRWYLHSGGQARSLGDGKLDRDQPRGESADRFTHDPKNLVPTEGGALFPPRDAGPADVSDLARRPDVVSYTTAAFSRDTEVTGPIKAKIWITADTPDVDVAVTLADVDSSGKARLLVDGIARARSRSGGSSAWLSSGNPAAIDVDLWGISHVVKKGHKLRLHVAASNYPRFAPNPCTKEDPGAATRFVGSQVRVYHDGDHPSHVELSVR